MSEVWVIAVVVAVIAVAAFVLYRRRSAGPGTEVEGLAAEPPAPAIQEQHVEPEPAAAAPEVEEVAIAVEELAESGPEPVVEAADVAAAPPGPSEQDLQSRVGQRLEESERMLAELGRAVEHSEAAAHQIGPGMLAVMEEGLEEVRTLARRKKWSQAKDKGDALHAQLSLMLQSARREQAT